MYKVPQHIRKKMQSALKHFQRGSVIMNGVNEYFEGLGFTSDELRSGNGISLEEIEYGNDVVDAFCESIENRIE